MAPLLATKTKHDELIVVPRDVDANKRIKQLKENMRIALMMTSNPTTKMQLVDTIQRLGVGYHFEEEINTVLKSLTHALPNEDIYTTALRFRLQRHNGLYTNPADDVFQNFMDANGKVKKSLIEDIEGLLSLYEASYLGTNEEVFLIHAKDFTTKHLHESVSKLSPKVQQKVVEALKLPRHMRMEMFETRRYIEEYENEDDHNPILLEFAKLDYKQCITLLRKELVEVTSWWEDLGIASTLSFVRDRHVECFLWAMGVLPEPKYNGCRIALAKAIAIMLVIDDIYDTYGSYDDLVSFTKAIQRWDLNEVDQLPEYMKTCYMALHKTNNEICDQVFKQQGLSVQPFLQKTWIDLAQAYMVEVEWTKRDIEPSLKEYLDNGVITSGTYMAMVHVFFFLPIGLTNENIRHILDPYPKFFTLAGTILRLWDDLGTSKEEEERGDILSSVRLLIKEKKITCEEKGRKEILHIIHCLWEDLNAEMIMPDVTLLPMIHVAFNTSRVSRVVYQHNEDSYLSSVGNQVQNLFFTPMDTLFNHAPVV